MTDKLAVCSNPSYGCLTQRESHLPHKAHHLFSTLCITAKSDGISGCSSCSSAPAPLAPLLCPPTQESSFLRLFALSAPITQADLPADIRFTSSHPSLYPDLTLSTADFSYPAYRFNFFPVALFTFLIVYHFFIYYDY